MDADDIKEQPLDDVKEQSADDVKEELLDDIKEEPLDDVKEEPLDDVKEEPLNDVKEQPLDDVKEEQLDDVKEESLAVFKNTELSSITLPKNIEYIGKQAFQDCTSLGSIDLPDSKLLNDLKDNDHLIEESYANTEPDNESELITESDCTSSKIPSQNTLIDILDESEFELIEKIDVESKEVESKESFKLPKIDISLCNAIRDNNYDSLFNAPRKVESNDVFNKNKTDKPIDTVQKKKPWWRFW